MALMATLIAQVLPRFSSHVSVFYRCRVAGPVPPDLILSISARRFPGLHTPNHLPGVGVALSREGMDPANRRAFSSPSSSCHATIRAGTVQAFFLAFFLLSI